MGHGQPGYLTLLVAPNKVNFLPLRAVTYSAFAVSTIFISGCAAPLVAISSSGSTAASTVGVAAASNPSTAASLASTAATGKSPLEHAASAATKKECSFFNLIDSKPICIEITLPIVTDKSEPLLGPADTFKNSTQQ